MEVIKHKQIITKEIQNYGDLKKISELTKECWKSSEENQKYVENLTHLTTWEVSGIRKKVFLMLLKQSKRNKFQQMKYPKRHDKLENLCRYVTKLFQMYEEVPKSFRT